MTQLHFSEVNIRLYPNETTLQFFFFVETSIFSAVLEDLKY